MKSAVQRGADHRRSAGAGGRGEDRGGLPAARDQRRRRSTNGRRSTAGWRLSEAQRLKSLEDENRRLKKLLAEAMLDIAALKDLLAKN